MSSRVPDAWDDDYEEVSASNPSPRATPTKSKATRAERRAQHTEAQRALWNSAENPEPFHFVATHSDVPLSGGFKPAVTVLSRKPKIDTKPTILARPSNGNGGRDEDDDPDSEEEARREQERTFKARQERARIEREEKQRKYNEVRSRLFGPEDGEQQPSSSGTSSPTRAVNGVGRSRGARGTGRGKGGAGSSASTRDSSADQSPARGLNGNMKLYDAGYSAKPGSTYLASRESESENQRESPVIRQPKGPDSDRRGFAPRGRGGLP